MVHNYLYDFNSEYEYRTYKNIGKDYIIDAKSNKNKIYKLKSQIRKCLNRDDKKYKRFDKYSQWKEYIECNYKNVNYDNKDDFAHFLLDHKRRSHSVWTSIGAIVTPIYVCFITIVISCGPKMTGEISWKSTFLFMSFLLVIILAYLLYNNLKNQGKYYFYNDILEIINSDIT